MVFMPVSTNGLNQLPRRLYPHGTAMNNTLNQVAGAIGTALMVTLMTTYANSRAKELKCNSYAEVNRSTNRRSINANAGSNHDASDIRWN